MIKKMTSQWFGGQSIVEINQGNMLPPIKPPTQQTFLGLVTQSSWGTIAWQAKRMFAKEITSDPYKPNTAMRLLVLN